MPKYNAYDVILEGYKVASIEDVNTFVEGFDFSEVELNESVITFGRDIDVINGIGIHYDYGADYYFFSEVKTDVEN